MLSLGWWAVHGLNLDQHPDRLGKLARLTLDPRWRVTFRFINIGHVPGGPTTPTFKGAIARAALAASVEKALCSSSSREIQFGVSRQEAGDHAWLHLAPGRTPVHGGIAPNMCLAKWRLAGHDAGEIAAWCELAHELTDTLSAEHGIITIGDDAGELRSDLWLSNITIEGRAQHPDPGEISSLGAQPFMLGERVRRPHWGTYVNPDHVAAVGGRDRILEVVRPPVVRDIGKLLYVQLSERVEEALTPETQARRRAFADLLAPITVPRLPDRP